jgi:hypothetical protein
MSQLGRWKRCRLIGSFISCVELSVFGYWVWDLFEVAQAGHSRLGAGGAHTSMDMSLIVVFATLLPSIHC